MIHLRKITEENFIDAFHLKLAPEQERFVSHPIRSLAQAYVYREPVSYTHLDVYKRQPRSFLSAVSIARFSSPIRTGLSR